MEKPAVTLEEEITVIAGANRLTAYAFNNDNVKSKDAQLPLTGADSLKRAGTAYIIAVGVNEYANKQYNLKYAVADAQSFADEVAHRLTQVSPSRARRSDSACSTITRPRRIFSRPCKRLAGAPSDANADSATPLDQSQAR